MDEYVVVIILAGKECLKINKKSQNGHNLKIKV